MEQETLEITKQVNLVKDYRQDIKNQIEKCAISVFGDTHLNVEAHIYGSVATGLALLESDMDIVITGVNNYDNKDKHISNLTELYNKIKSEFSSQILTMSKQILFTQVPIIKLEFSLKDYYNKRIEDDISALPYIEFDSES